MHTARDMYALAEGSVISFNISCGMNVISDIFLYATSVPT